MSEIRELTNLQLMGAALLASEPGTLMRELVYRIAALEEKIDFLTNEAKGPNGPIRFRGMRTAPGEQS